MHDEAPAFIHLVGREDLSNGSWFHKIDFAVANAPFGANDYRSACQVTTTAGRSVRPLMSAIALPHGTAACGRSATFDTPAPTGRCPLGQLNLGLFGYKS